MNFEIGQQSINSRSLLSHGYIQTNFASLNSKAAKLSLPLNTSIRHVRAGLKLLITGTIGSTFDLGAVDERNKPNFNCAVYSHSCGRPNYPGS